MNPEEVAKGTAILIKPLFRGWSHAIAALAAIMMTIALAWETRDHLNGMIPLLVYGFSMTLLYSWSAFYNIGAWKGRLDTVFCAIDHSNIFVMIAGSMTPVLYVMLNGWTRVIVMTTVWLLAGTGIATSIFSLKLPRWFLTGRYVLMGLIGVIFQPIFLPMMGLNAFLILLLCGVFYIIGAVVYTLMWPDPIPHIFGYHEVFHIFIISGSVSMAAVVWFWVLPLLLV